MSNGGFKSAPGSGRTSARLSDREFLRQEATQARVAMRATVSDMTQTVKGGLNLDAAAADHPWITVGSAAAVGLVAGEIVTYKRNRREAPQPQPDPHPAKQHLSPALTYILSVLATPVVDIIKGFAAGIVSPSFDSTDTAPPAQSEVPDDVPSTPSI